MARDHKDNGNSRTYRSRTLDRHGNHIATLRHGWKGLVKLHKGSSYSLRGVREVKIKVTIRTVP